MDAQIWYAIFSTLFGGIHGAFSHLGEVSDEVSSLTTRKIESNAININNTGALNTIYQCMTILD